MKTKFTLLLATLFLLTTNCGDKNKLEYKYTNLDDTIKCGTTSVNYPLLKDAFYSFEEDVKNNFAKNTGNKAQGYSIFINTIGAGRALDPAKVSMHSRNILEQLKKEDGLWVNNNGKYELNYSSDLVKCLSDNITDKDLQTTFKALIETNSMSSKIFAAPLRTKVRNLQNNKFLATYVALDMYYSKLMNVDFSTVEAPKEEEKWEKSSPPSATQKPQLQQ